MNGKLTVILALALCCPIAVRAEDQRAQNQDQSIRARMGEIKDQAGFHKMVDQATEVYSSIAKGSHGTVPASVLTNARCIAVLPNVITGALVVGGTHGEGFASCKDGGDKWSQLAPISLNQGSIGLQAGAKSADLVLFFQSKDAVQALKRGEFALGTDVSAVAGTYDSSIDTSKAGVVVYTRAEGLFAGASVNGSKIGKDDDELANYYGKKVDYTAMLEGKDSPDSAGYADKLTKLFP